MQVRIYCVLILVIAAGLAACARREDSFSWGEYAAANEAQREVMGMETRWDSRPPSPAMPVDADMPDDVSLRHNHAVYDMATGASGRAEWGDIAGSGQRHIIQTANVEMDTEYFSNVVEELRRLAPAASGFVESEMLTTRGRQMFTIVLRIPAASFEAVLQQVENLADVRVSNQLAQDVTDQFYDMAGSLEIRRLEEERILALIEEAETVHELLALEQRLSNTRLMIEMYLSQLNNMAGQIAYSTINVTLFNVAQVEDDALVPTLGERIGGAFGDSVDGTVDAVQNFVVFLAGVVIPLILLGLVGVVVFLIARGRVKKKISA